MLIWVLIAVAVLVLGFGGVLWHRSGAAEVDDSELEDYQEQFVSHDHKTL
jgi:hypothetical protein